MKKKKLPFDFRHSPRLTALLKAALAEDIGPGDTTTETIVPKSIGAKAYVLARQSGIFCGGEIAKELFRLVDSKVKLRFLVPEGGRFRRNQKVIVIQGSVQSILQAERTALNFLGRLCGISTKTRQFVDRIKRHKVAVLGTRKTTPLWREIEKYAVRVGGGRNHRMGLWDTIFVKENHRPYGDLGCLRRHPRRFHIEVRNLREMWEALSLKPRVILFDNFSPRDLQRAVRLARKSQPDVILEASGGIHLQNILRYAKTGVNWISSGDLTHSVRAVNFSLLIEKKQKSIQKPQR
ncbi:MAG: carboxylating nicotinate-nucleotide diphosphorylase [Candidatus Omnitrophica bacterium]|nr:carboxylating nicotinate-nucleotide diphosphorylase [Candidatus Omnitrophota bacterium]